MPDLEVDLVDQFICPPCVESALQIDIQLYSQFLINDPFCRRPTVEPPNDVQSSVSLWSPTSGPVINKGLPQGRTWCIFQILFG